ncbi:MAG: putative molybdenum carrier protein [Candidatus Rifleibacteriota bacterium]
MGKYEIAMIISGGQTGVDRAALDFALRQQINCSGWCPKGRRAEDGVIPSKYPLVETGSELYQQRTRLNVRHSDATLVITDGAKSRGTSLTVKYACSCNKPCLVMNSKDDSELKKLKKWLKRYKPQILNIAGPRGSETGMIYQLATEILNKSFKQTTEKIFPTWPPLRPETGDLFAATRDK